METAVGWEVGVFVGMQLQKPLPVFDTIGWWPEYCEQAITEHLDQVLAVFWILQISHHKIQDSRLKSSSLPCSVGLDDEVIIQRRIWIEADPSTSCVVTVPKSVSFLAHYRRIWTNLIWSSLHWNPYAALKGHRSKVSQSFNRKYRSSTFAPRPNDFVGHYWKGGGHVASWSKTLTDLYTHTILSKCWPSYATACCTMRIPSPIVTYLSVQPQKCRTMTVFCSFLTSEQILSHTQSWLEVAQKWPAVETVQLECQKNCKNVAFRLRKRIASRRNGNEPCHILGGAFTDACQRVVLGSFRDEVKLVLGSRVSADEALRTISACVELSKLTSKRLDKNKASVNSW